jgi:hypothetical protein
MSYTELTCKEVRCRKQHLCSWCGNVILKGEQAQYRSGIFQGDFGAGYEHPECYEAMMSIPSKDFPHDEGWMPGDYLRGSTEWA